MKLSGRDAARYFARPDPAKTALLLYGGDAMRVSLRREEVISALVGPEGEAEMRLTRLPAADLRKDSAALLDGVKAQGFFPGARVVFVDGATDGLTDVFSAALADWQEGDAQIVVTAGSLNARSKLRKLFETHRNSYAIGIYDDPPSREEIAATLAKSGVSEPDRDAMSAIEALARTLDPGDFRQTIEKLGLYKLNDPSPISVAEVEAVAPLSTEAALDDVLNIVAEAQSDQIGPVMARLKSQGMQPVSLCIGAMRHFRALHVAASDPGGPGAGMNRLRPPVYGPRRDRMQRQAQQWGLRRLEQAIAMLTETDLQLRSASRAPAMAAMERTLVRLAMLGRAR